MYMGPLLAETINHFEATLAPGEHIPFVWGNWSNEGRSDNWSQYRAYLREQGPGPYSPEQKAAAAASTKTGGLVAKHGFTVVDGVEIHEQNRGQHVMVKFRRPEDYRPEA
jgi:hypothetical protein